MNLTFGSYNLEFGGIDGGNDARLSRQLALLADAAADVWAFQECNDWRSPIRRAPGKPETQAVYMAEDILDMRGFLIDGAHGFPVALFVAETPHLRVTAERHETRRPYWHGVARIAIAITGFGPLYLASAHMAPSSPAQRLAEAEAFALMAEQGPLIAGADWNAVPIGDPDPDTEGMHPAKVRRILTILPPDTITGYRVIREDNPESDHRPVIATFKLPEEAPASRPDGAR